MLRAWWALWLGMWLTFWWFAVRSLTADFTAKNMSVGLATDGQASLARWSGTGTWQPPSAEGTAAQVVMAVGQAPSTGFTVGTQASPVLRLQTGDCVLTVAAECFATVDGAGEVEPYVFTRTG